MRFQARQLWFPRDSGSPRDYEDASSHSEALGRAVIADGVSSAIFSRLWSRLLTRHALRFPPPVATDEAFMEWLAPLQRSWGSDDAILKARGDWARADKLRSIGAQATLLAMDIEPLATQPNEPAEYRLRVCAIGDSVLYLVRDGKKLFSFPLAESADFAMPPNVVSSIARDVSYAGRFLHLDERCREGDLLVLCTDAIGKWSMQEYEAGVDVDWMRYWDDTSAWQEDIQRLRAKHPADPGNRLVVDDCTLLLMMVVPETILTAEPFAAPDRSDEPFVLLTPPEGTPGAGLAAASGHSSAMNETERSPELASATPAGADGAASTADGSFADGVVMAESVDSDPGDRSNPESRSSEVLSDKAPARPVDDIAPSDHSATALPSDSSRGEKPVEEGAGGDRTWFSSFTSLFDAKESRD